MVRISLAVTLAIMLAGCTTTEYVPQVRTVEIPVIEYRVPEAPSRLTDPFTPSRVQFSQVNGMICMDPDNAAALRSDLEKVSGKLDAWEAFYFEANNVE